MRSLIKRLRRTRPSIDPFVPSSPTTRKAAGHKNDTPRYTTRILSLLFWLCSRPD